MKKLIKLTAAIFFAAACLYAAINNTTKSFATEQSHSVQYVQCVVVDNKVHQCTDITDGKLMNTKLISEVINK